MGYRIDVERPVRTARDMAHPLGIALDRETTSMAWEKETEEHRRIWDGFTRFVAISTGSVLAVVALMAIFLL